MCIKPCFNLFIHQNRMGSDEFQPAFFDSLKFFIDLKSLYTWRSAGRCSYLDKASFIMLFSICTTNGIHFSSRTVKFLLAELPTTSAIADAPYVTTISFCCKVSKSNPHFSLGFASTKPRMFLACAILGPSMNSTFLFVRLI